jgi:hypothetical protein
MVKSIANFAQINMEQLFRYSPIGMKPMFCIAPEAFDPIYMIPSLGLPFLFADHDMITANRKRCIRLPFIGVVKTSRFGMSHHQFNDLFFISFLHGENLDFTIPLKDSQNNDFTSSAPSTLTRVIATNRCFIAFYGPAEGFPALLLSGATCPDMAKESLNCRGGSNPTKAKPIARNSIDEKLDQFSLGRVRQPAGGPYTRHTVSGTTRAALGPSISKLPTPSISTLRASFHMDQNTQSLVQFN